MNPLGGPMGRLSACRLVGLGCLGAASLLAGVACSPAFVAGGAAGSGGATGASSTSTGGATTGSGGAPGCPACPTDQYCNPQSSMCEPCAQSTRFSFGPPVAIPLAVPMPGASALYPRVDTPTGDLYLVQQGQGVAHLNQLASAPYTGAKPFPWTAATLLSQLAGTHQDSGPFPLQDPAQLEGVVGDPISKLGMPVLLFDSDRVAGERRVFAIGLQQASPTQLTLPGTATRESRIAVATAASPVRFFWISNGGGSAAERLVTATGTDTSVTPVTVTLETGCVTPLADTPWVTPGGDRLLFSSAAYGPSPACTTPDATVTHLYQVSLDASGQPTGKAQRIYASDDSTDTTPALAPNRCTLLFSRVDAGVVKLYAAPRD